MKIFKIDLVLQHESIKFYRLCNKPLFPHYDVDRTNGRKIVRISYVTTLDSSAMDNRPQFYQNPAQVLRYIIINYPALKNNPNQILNEN